MGKMKKEIKILYIEFYNETIIIRKIPDEIKNKIKNKKPARKSSTQSKAEPSGTGPHTGGPPEDIGPMGRIKPYFACHRDPGQTVWPSPC